jgi:phosphoribosylformylglycinamidine synthase
MILFAKNAQGSIYAVGYTNELSVEDKQKLNWLFDGEVLADTQLKGWFVGPRKEMLTPWSTNAVEITQRRI